MAAVLACGPGALLMGAASAHNYGLIKGPPPPPVVKTWTERRIERIETHRTRKRQRGTEWKGIPTTTVPATLSELEERFLATLRANHLPIPITNRVATAKRVDCRWPGHHLTVELDSYRYHATRHAWEEDRRREREAHARGDQHRRYTYGDVFEDPRLMLVELTQLLA